MNTQKSSGEIPVVTRVHDAQVVDAVPYEDKDEKTTIVVIPTRAIHVPR
jgi:5-formyltetrahydrofolate cyclo-ligase